MSKFSKLVETAMKEMKSVPKNMTTMADNNYVEARTIAEKKAKMSLPNFKMPKVKYVKDPNAPANYKIPDQSKLKNIGVGWGGEKPKKIK